MQSLSSPCLLCPRQAHVLILISVFLMLQEHGKWQPHEKLSLTLEYYEIF